MFSIAQRAATRTRIIKMAEADQRIVAGGEFGSAVTDAGADRWSDLDLTFALAPNVDAFDVLDDWRAEFRAQDAVHLFDLTSIATTYRVFLFPNNLQADVSVTPDAIAKMGPKFRLLFGTAVKQVQATPVSMLEVFGLAVHHALRARISIERKRWWAARYYIDELRNETLSLACLAQGLPSKYARGLDELPPPLLDQASVAIAHSLERPELLRAVRAGIELLVAVIDATGGLPDVTSSLHELMRDPLV